MGESTHLTPLHIELAQLFFSLKCADGYLAAGGAGLLAFDLIDRPTEDLDLFGSMPITSVLEAKEQFLEALRQHGYRATVVEDSPTFCRFTVRRDEDELLVDLAIDSPPISTPALTLLGPTLAPLELGGRKLLALFARAEARDFADVYKLARHFGKHALIEQARSLDAGFSTGVLAQMLRTVDRLADDEIPLGQSDLRLAKAFFDAWAQELREGPLG